MNPDFQKVGESFVNYYYQEFDNEATKCNVARLYHDSVLLTFENDQKQGKVPVIEKLMNLPLTKRIITKCDCQPMADQAILVVVLGQVITPGETKSLGFTNTFVLRPQDGSYFIFNEIFQLNLHNAWQEIARHNSQVVINPVTLIQMTFLRDDWFIGILWCTLTASLWVQCKENALQYCNQCRSRPLYVFMNHSEPQNNSNSDSGVVFVKLLRESSNLSENFKCRFLYVYPQYFNETLHAYKLEICNFLSLKFSLGAL